jgi:PIN domain nuclease of toxin-antitoxin system
VDEIGLDVVEEAYSLPEPFHRDPADRIIVATARRRDCPVVTADAKIRGYPHVRTLWNE